MDIIQQMIKGSGEILAKILTRRDESLEITVEQAANAAETGILIWSLVSMNDYTAAEKLLFDEMKKNFDFDLYNTGLDFFETLFNLSDENLGKHNYTREDIIKGEQKLFEMVKYRCGLTE